MGAPTKEAEDLVETTESRAPRGIRAEVPFAELSGRVTGGFQVLREDGFAHGQAAAGLAAGVETQALLIASSHQASASG